MKKLDINNKGFTLVELIAVIVIIAIVGLIAVPSVINIINTGKNASYDILVSDITIASKQLFEEVDILKNDINYYTKDGESGAVSISENTIKINLQTLVSNGFLTGTNNSDKEDNKNDKIIANPKNNKDIGSCEIIITKSIDSDFNTSYKIENNSSSNANCPTDDEYKNALNGN